MRGVLGLGGGASSSPSITAAVAEEEAEENDEEEEEEELELGLSLRAKSLATLKSAPRGLGCRILTAKDLPQLKSRASPLTSPRSSAASSSSSPAAAAGAGSKRAKADNNPSPEAAGSAHPPSQMVVGWPPIRAFRMNSLVNLSNKDHTPQEANVGAGKESNADFKSGGKMPRAAASSPFVKVYMDGDPIGRKVDLSAHHSYESLSLSLEFMFHSPTLPFPASIINKLSDGSSEFALTYEDREGDCMLVGDVPWEMFLDNVKRLRIMRTSDAGGLAPRFHSNNSIGSIDKVGPDASSLKRR